MNTYYLRIKVQPPKGYKPKFYNGLYVSENAPKAQEETKRRLFAATKKDNPDLDLTIKVMDCIKCTDFGFFPDKITKANNT
jgi:hypothetical protein